VEQLTRILAKDFAFLAGHAASWVTAQNIKVNGGTVRLVLQPAHGARVWNDRYPGGKEVPEHVIRLSDHVGLFFRSAQADLRQEKKNCRCPDFGFPAPLGPSSPNTVPTCSTRPTSRSR